MDMTELTDRAFDGLSVIPARVVRENIIDTPLYSSLIQ